jgi:hypothetical protein
MFEEIKLELLKIPTPKFHKIDKYCFENDNQFRRLKLPNSYKSFLTEIGTVKLFREGGGYIVGVYPIISDLKLSDGDFALNFGHYDSHKVWFKKSQLFFDEPPVYQNKDSKMVEAAPNFIDWLNNSLSAAKRRYTKKEWEKILRGPSPFNKRELSIVQARKDFHWKILGVTKENKVQFQVTNSSCLILPYLSIGVRHKDGSFEGGIWLNTLNINPGQTAIVEKDCYSELTCFNDLEFFDEIDPEPEDRDQYWEFKLVR